MTTTSSTARPQYAADEDFAFGAKKRGFKVLVDSRSVPPGPIASWLGETIVHGEDIFRSFGPYRDHKTDYVIAAADFYKNSNALIGSKSRIAGVTLK